MRLIFVAEQQHILVCRFTHVYITYAQTPLLPVTSPSVHAFAPLTPWTCWRGAIHLREVLIHSPLQLREGIPIPMTPPAFPFFRANSEISPQPLDSATDFFRVAQLQALQSRCQELPSHGAHQAHARQCYGSSSALHSCGSLAKSVSRFTLTWGASSTRSTVLRKLFCVA